MEFVNKINIGAYLKNNIKNIISILILLIAIIIFIYSIYLFYDVAVANKKIGDNMLINTKKDVILEDEILSKIKEHRNIKPTVGIRLNNIVDPFN